MREANGFTLKGMRTVVDENGPHYFVVFHSPGAKWVKGTPYNEQPEFMTRVNYISGLHDQGKIILSGPFMESPGGLSGKLADGGMAIIKAADLKEATKLGTDDPTVKSGMLKADIKTLWVPFHE
jgi:uncharacterized protein YciI